MTWAWVLAEGCVQCELLVDLRVTRIFHCIEQPTEATSMERDRFSEASETAG
jgi:hypothetical protein